MVTKKRTSRPRKSSKPQLCKIHGKPIRLSRWRSGHRTTGCAKCYRTRTVPPPRKRLCQRHKLPILGARWRSGYRTKGCRRCFKVPPAEDRLCRRHGRPIQPSMWIRGRHSTGCCVCSNSRPGYAAAKARYRERVRLRGVLRAKKKKRSA